MSEVAELIAELLAEVWNDGDIIAGPNERDRRAADALATLTARVAELERERDEARSSVAAIADYVEPHWRGAGLALDHEWILRRLQLSSERREDAEDRADAAEARLANAVEALRKIADWRKKPWTDMADDDAEQLKSTSHALGLACSFARTALSELEG